MSRLAELKLRFRLRISVPIQEKQWRKKLNSSLPSAQLLSRYYDASSEIHTDVLHPTLLWEDPRCPTIVQPVVQQWTANAAPAVTFPPPVPPQMAPGAMALA